MGLATVAPSHSRTSLRPGQEVLRFACLDLHTLPHSSRHRAGIDRAKGSAGTVSARASAGFHPWTVKAKAATDNSSPSPHTPSGESEHTGKPILTRGTLKIYQLSSGSVNLEYLPLNIFRSGFRLPAPASVRSFALALRISPAGSYARETAQLAEKKASI